MNGKIYITRHGYDPQKGRFVKDPFLDGLPTMGACRPDIRKSLNIGDTIVAISGKVRGFDQFVMGCFDVGEKITMLEAYKRFPEQRLRKRADGQLAGNIIIDENGNQHSLDDHSNYANRTSDYVVGENEIILQSDQEIEKGREGTMTILRELFKKSGSKPFDILGRSAKKMNTHQVDELKSWLKEIKQDSI